MAWTNIKNEPFEKEVYDVLEDFGFDLNEAKQWRWKYARLRNRTSKGPARLKLSFRQYMKLVVRAGITELDEIGGSAGKYQLGRKGDKGHYEWGNCRFITIEQNKKEQKINGGYERAGLKRRGLTKETDEGYASISKSLSGRNRFTHEHVALQAKTISKKFKVRSPQGKSYEGLNLKEFCRVNSLHQGAMSAVCRGEKTSYKGWTGTYAG